MYRSIHGNPVNLNPIKKELKTFQNHWDTENRLPIYESYMPDLSSEYARQAMCKNFSPAYISNVEFDKDELSWMYGFAFVGCHNVRHNANGTIFTSGNLDQVATKFLDKLEKILPGCSESPLVGGNFLITPTQYGLHNDSTRRSDWVNSLTTVAEDHPGRKYVPWKNILIPMWIGNTPSTVSHGVWFEQRHVDFAHVYYHDGHNNPTQPATTYPIIYDYSTIDFYNSRGEIIPKENNLVPYDEEHYREYLEYTPKSRLTGLTPELTVEWQPGVPFVFDAVQLHATNKGTKCRTEYLVYSNPELKKPVYKKFGNTDYTTEDIVARLEERTNWDVKMGLLLTFLKEIK